MRKIVAWAISPLVLALSMAAAAAPGDLSPTLRATMQRDLDMTSAQLSQYLATERLAMAHRGSLAKAHDRHYAGSWIERMPNGDFQFVMASTSTRAKGIPSGVAVRKARHTLAQLDASKAELDTHAARSGAIPAGIYAWGVDVRSNAVTVDVAPGAQQAAIDFVAASGADTSTIRFDTMGSAPRPLVTLEGGSEYLSKVDGSYYYCSVGFGVTRSGIEGYVTAGHCGNANDGVYTLANRRTVGPQIGAFKSSFFGASGDGAHVELFSGHAVTATVKGYDQPVRGQTVAPEGAAVCRSGRTTGLKCGTILKYNQTVNYAEGAVNGLTSAQVCAEGGDSGGSFISGDQAQGVLSGGNYNCKGKNASLATSYFQPIAEILGSQLTLKTAN